MYLRAMTRANGAGVALGAFEPAFGTDDLARMFGLLTFGMVVFGALGEPPPSEQAFARFADLVLRASDASNDTEQPAALSRVGAGPRRRNGRSERSTTASSTRYATGTACARSGWPRTCRTSASGRCCARVKLSDAQRACGGDVVLSLCDDRHHRAPPRGRIRCPGCAREARLAPRGAPSPRGRRGGASPVLGRPGRARLAGAARPRGARRLRLRAARSSSSWSRSSAGRSRPGRSSRP